MQGSAGTICVQAISLIRKFPSVMKSSDPLGFKTFKKMGSVYGFLDCSCFDITNRKWNNSNNFVSICNFMWYTWLKMLHSTYVTFRLILLRFLNIQKDQNQSYCTWYSFLQDFDSSVWSVQASSIMGVVTHPSRFHVVHCFF